jgi:hypothetical protein
VVDEQIAGSDLGEDIGVRRLNARMRSWNPLLALQRRAIEVRDRREAPEVQRAVDRDDLIL